MKIEKMNNDIFNYLVNNFSVIKNSENVIIISATHFKYFLRMHLEKNFISLSDSPKVELLERWNEFVTNYKQNLLDRYDLLQLEFNPLDNTDKYSEIITDEDTTTTMDVAKREGSSTDTNQVAGFNSESFSNSEKNISSSSTNAYQDKDTYKRDVKVTEHVHGNIGVTSSVQLLNEAQELRSFNLAKWFIDLFADENLFYC